MQRGKCRGGGPNIWGLRHWIGQFSVPVVPVLASGVERLLGTESRSEPVESKAYYQAFFWVLIDLIVELLGLIIKPFDNQTES